MKIIKWIIVIIILLTIVSFIYDYIKPEGMREYRSNKELESINENWKGNLTIGGEYTNGDTKEKQIMPIDILKWKLSKNPQSKEKNDELFQLKVRKDDSFLTSKEDMIVWLGHASFFIRMDGTTFITDPIFYDITFINRLAGLPCDVNKLIGIDYILLSHGHRDHFDKKSLQVLFKNNPNIQALVPLGLNKYFDKNKIKNQQAAWYQKYNTPNNIEVYFMPSKHWNRRGLLDFNRNLWGSFIIKNKNKTIYFSGDTAYGNHFKDIKTYFSEIDYCLLSIGAYKPEIIMKDSHMNPQEALKAFEDLQGRTFIPMHYGTYDLSDEPIGEPIRLIEEEKNNYNISILDIGQIQKF